MINISTMFRSRVTGSRSPIFWSTGRASGENDLPKSRRTMRVSHFQYWTWSGLSRSYSSIKSFWISLSDWMLRSPVWISPGVPGARWITRNEMKVMPMRMGMASRSRRSAYRNMARAILSQSATSPRRVALEVLRHVPLVEVVPDAVRPRDDPPHARRDHRQRVPEVEEDDRLVLGEDLLEPVVVRLPLLLDAR